MWRLLRTLMVRLLKRVLENKPLDLAMFEEIQIDALLTVVKRVEQNDNTNVDCN